jgi:hypothetical protein
MRYDEDSFEAGRRIAWGLILQQCVAELGEEGRERAGWLIERQQAIAALLEICKEHGDTSWHESLNLADVIDNHLGRHLRERSKAATREPVGWIKRSTVEFGLKRPHGDGWEPLYSE